MLTTVDDDVNDTSHPRITTRVLPPATSTTSDSTPHKSTIQSLAKSYRKLRRQDESDEPPRFTIDLSLPPQERYRQVCASLATELQILPVVFEDTIKHVVTRVIPWPFFRILCRTFIRKVYDREENGELKGISQATGLSMYLLVCFNVLLDLFMGCSSGAAAVRDEQSEDEKAVKMVHFRTLDWDMDQLRHLVVQLDFVQQHNGPVIATSITYAGYVGVLTGVRKDLSLSLNFRPNRSKPERKRDDWRYYYHILMILLGERRSISSTLRTFLFSKRSTLPPSYSTILDLITGQSSDPTSKPTKPLRTPSCYLCFSNGLDTRVFEKDFRSSVNRRDTEFIVVTNNDQIPDPNASSNVVKPLPTAAGKMEAIGHRTTLAAIIAEGEDRRKCAMDNWRRMRLFKADPHNSSSSEKNAQRSRSEDKNSNSEEEEETKDKMGGEKDHETENLIPHPSEMSIADVTELVQRYPTTNECTNFACIMDPSVGRVVWCRRWRKPISDNWILEHANRVQDMYCLRTELFFGS